MIKNLLLVSSLLASAVSFSQFTQTNEAAIGAGSTLYVIDSTAADLSNITGVGVTWDYSMYAGYDGASRNVTVLDPSTTPNASDFGSSAKAIEIENATTNYFNSTAASRVGQGYVFVEQTFGEVKLVFNNDEATLMTYPMAVGDVVNDTYSGTLYYSFSGIPQDQAATGTIMTTVDGSGTLVLANGVSYTNVLRYQSVDTADVNGTPIGDLQLIRRSFEYYDLATSNLPIFVHSYIKVGQAGGAPLTEFSLPLSIVDPADHVGLSTDEFNSFKVYPNPATDNITISSTEKGAYKIISTNGKIVAEGNTAELISKVNVSSLKAGIYVVEFKTEKNTSIERIVIK